MVYPPAMAPITRKGSFPEATSSGNGASGDSCDRSSLAREEPYERAAFPSRVVADGAAQHRIAGLQCVEDGALRHRALHVERDLVADVRERPQMMRKHDADHRSVCTSTESTGGRSRTIGAQVSPASADAYTWPPVVPKYTPHLSSESTAIASRSTFT